MLHYAEKRGIKDGLRGQSRFMSMHGYVDAHCYGDLYSLVQIFVGQVNVVDSVHSEVRTGLLGRPTRNRVRIFRC